VRRFLEGGQLFEGAVKEYISAVEQGEFPAREHSFGLEGDSNQEDR
jgi:ketopantoate hydroxymethyltransferase